MSTLELSLLHQGPHAFKALLGRPEGETAGVLNAYRNPEGDLVASLHLLRVPPDDELCEEGGLGIARSLQEAIGLDPEDLDVFALAPPPEPLPEALGEIRVAIGATACGEEGGRWTAFRDDVEPQVPLLRLERIVSEQRTWTTLAVFEPALRDRERAMRFLSQLDGMLKYDPRAGEQLLELYHATPL